VVGGVSTRAPVAQVLDVLIATTGRSHEATDEDYALNPPAADAGAFDLGYGVRIERLPFDDVELVMNACDPRGHFFISKRQYGQHYSYIYEPAETDWQQNPSGWDPEQRLNAAMHLSRLVKDNSDSMEYAARSTIHDDGDRQVVPRHDCELGRAYSLRTGRDWLDPDGRSTPVTLALCVACRASCETCDSFRAASSTICKPAGKGKPGRPRRTPEIHTALLVLACSILSWRRLKSL
jgi:hypothetical protein